MLRRDFIKSGSILVGGVVLLRQIPLAEPAEYKSAQTPSRKPVLRHHGDRRCGCATPPDRQALMEWGLFRPLPD